MSRYGDRAVLLDADDPVGLALAARQVPGVVDAVPGARSLLVTAVDAAALHRLVPALAALAPLPRSQEHELVEVPVSYDGPDLEHVADASGLTVDEVVALHCGGSYEVALIGFVPGFGYLKGLDVRLHLTRRDDPRPAVPAGSVALAGGWTGVYPRRGPGGWHLIGTTDLVLWDLEASPPALLRPGVTVRFVPA